MIKVIILILLAYYLLTTVILLKYFEKNFMYLYLSIITTFLIEDEQDPILEDVYDKTKYPKGLLTLTHRTSIVMAFVPTVRWKALKDLRQFKDISKNNIFSSILEGHYAHLTKTDPEKLETLDYFQDIKTYIEQ